MSKFPTNKLLFKNRKIDKKITLESVIYYFSCDDRDIREKYISYLIRQGENIIPLLLQTLTNEIVRVRYYSAIVLGKLKAKNAIDKLIQLLADKELYGVVADAAERALEEIKEEEELIKSLENKKIAKRVARILGDIKSQKAVPYLIRCLRKTTDNDTRAACIRALGEIGDTSVIKTIRKYLCDHYKWIRYFSAEALLKLGDKSGIPIIRGAQNDFEHDSTEISDWATELLLKSREDGGENYGKN